MNFTLAQGAQGTLDHTKSFVKEIKFCAGLANDVENGEDLLLDASELRGVNLFVNTLSARDSVKMWKVPQIIHRAWSCPAHPNAAEGWG